MKIRIKSLLSPRTHLVPQIVGDRIFFISNLSGHLNLYAMEYGGSVPEPLLPNDIALQNPELLEGYSFYVFPLLDQVLVMLDENGDENYQPVMIPISGGFPTPIFGSTFSRKYRVHLAECDPEKNIIYFFAERKDISLFETFKGDLRAGELVKLDESIHGSHPQTPNSDHTRLILSETLTEGDVTLWILDHGKKDLLFGSNGQAGSSGQKAKQNGIISTAWTPSESAILTISAVFDDKYSLGLIDPQNPGVMEPVQLEGIAHVGVGEMTEISHQKGANYTISFNIDGCSWVYEARYNEARKTMTIKDVIIGDGDLQSGKAGPLYYDRKDDRLIFSFATAVSPTQIFTAESKERQVTVMHTQERILGLDEMLLSPGEDASFLSFDQTRISARLYMPSEKLGFSGARPLIYYIHGGPQSQERPDFAWFSMPLIQFLTFRGFAVFVPNVRGSSGYGLKFMKQVDSDWGGKDHMDHVHAMQKVLIKDKRLDMKRTAVMGRSYGGYMTLTLAGKNPELWAAACDMFGPYDLLTFSERIPETWKPYFKMALADPGTAEGKKFLIERSPRSHLSGLACPMLVIQGRNDPHVVARESEEMVAELRKAGKKIEFLVFEDEGHDVLKYVNRVTCYNAITDFFTTNLNP